MALKVFQTLFFTLVMWLLFWQSSHMSSSVLTDVYNADSYNAYDVSRLLAFMSYTNEPVELKNKQEQRTTDKTMEDLRY